MCLTRPDLLLRRVALLGLAVTMACLAIGATIDATGASFVAAEWVFSFGALPYAGVGTMVLWRRPRHRVAWLLLAVGVLLSSGFASEQVAIAVYVDGRTIPGSLLAVWYMQWYWLPFLYAAFIGIPLLFPTGHALSRRWSYIGRTALVLAVLTSLGGMFAQKLYIDFNYLDTALVFDNPVGFMPFSDIESEAMSPFVIFPILFMAILSVSSLVVRYRRSRGAERQQMRWGAFALSVTLAVFLAGVLLDTFGFDLPVVEGFFTFLAPLGIGVAITRYRLWDLDRLISRTVSYLALTVILAGVYGLLVLGVQGVLGPDDLPDLAVAVATLLTAAAFGPVRRRVQHVVDRRFNRSHYDAATVLDRLAIRLRDEVNPSSVEGDLLLVVEETMQPRALSLWVPTRPA